MNFQWKNKSFFPKGKCLTEKRPPLIPRKIGCGKIFTAMAYIFTLFSLIAYNHQKFPFPLSQENLKERHAGLESFVTRYHWTR